MSNYTVLAPSEVDWISYRDLRLEALQLEPQAFGSSYEAQKNDSDDIWKERLLKYVQGAGNWMLFVSNEQELVGMAGAFQNEDDIKQNSAQIIAVYVKGKHRGKGLGKALLLKLFVQLKLYGIRTANLSVNAKQEAAVKLYKNLGFVVIGKEKNKLGDGLEHDEDVMELSL